ncbi:transaldolase [Parabacteroides sp. PF5-5]|uniref:fructose-6-phosphate aldolase n=1 Tax=unclassified Parabacteroides TaxID=2649774 RepID=UPI0024744610|nr:MULTISPECIES: fructose-6-phosphate aldolase [unclassified Parabacteroides]MDH6303792.1 transaldolase [Parabacteroides sp. PH5-39]MDH6314409.1 transaldolase [Parabacteroides sp. PF5-13]MDH6318526.1 transaldolase [Parabacteroides sp. PH5-13]MDH6322181.1 transaldolase [Parabacteroides sp. PH5-8]MDH6325739.1 transaldolase [Parabacteroides sp. PH5-41]
MKFFIDTANLEQIKEANNLGVLDGVTTNPSLMAKEGIKGVANQRKHYTQICELVDGDVSAEVTALDFDGMVTEGKELAALHPNIVVKVPCTEDGIKAIRFFTDSGIRTNCTLVFSPGQALLAAKAGATYVSPFVGRLDDIASDGIELVKKIVQMYRYYNYTTKVLAASIRTTQHIMQCVEVGADVATCPLTAIKGLLKHPLTDSGLATFMADYNKIKE